MAKLKGAAKEKFIARMARGRRKAMRKRKSNPRKTSRKKTATKKRTPKKNPIRETIKRKINAATKLYRRFTGMEPKYIESRKINIPDVGMIIGKLDGVLYTTKRDGQTEEYIHRFTGRSRPTLCSSWDGKQLFIVDGHYNFTNEGIVDK